MGLFDDKVDTAGWVDFDRFYLQDADVWLNFKYKHRVNVKECLLAKYDLYWRKVDKHVLQRTRWEIVTAEELRLCLSMLDISAKLRDPGHVLWQEYPGIELTSLQVLEIRRMHWLGNCSYRDIALGYGVSAKTIGDIVKRRTWKAF